MLKVWSASDVLPEFIAEQASFGQANVELSALAEWFAALAAHSTPHETALARGRARLLASVTQPAERFQPLFGQLGEFFDLGSEALRALFIRAADPNAWQPGPLPWVSLFHFDGGPALAGLDTGLVRLSKGMPFPAHRHTASERVLILDGGYYDDEQRFHGPGEIHEMSAGTQHALLMNPERDVLLAVVLRGEIEVVGAP